MEGELWTEVYPILYEVNGKRIHPKGVQFSDARILEVFFGAAIHDRPTSWACRRENWPVQQRWRDLPCDATMRVRLRTVSVCLLMQALLDRLHASSHAALARVLHFKPLPVECYSKDRDAGWDWAATAKARGYKLFCGWGGGVVPEAWTLGPMNAGDPELGVKLVPQLVGAA